jgi:hypothetical protein
MEERESASKQARVSNGERVKTHHRGNPIIAAMQNLPLREDAEDASDGTGSVSADRTRVESDSVRSSAVKKLSMDENLA